MAQVIPLFYFGLSWHRRSSVCSAWKLSIAIGVGLAWAVAGCGNSVRNTEASQEVPKNIEEALAAHTDEWMSVPGVVGTAIGESEDRPCIVVLVAERTAEIEKKNSYVRGRIHGACSRERGDRGAQAKRAIDTERHPYSASSLTPDAAHGEARYGKQNS